MQPFDYLNTSVKSYARPSKVHGIGLFVLVDIKKGDEVFPIWNGETDYYKIKWVESSKVTKRSFSYVLRSYGSDIKSDDSFINFKLVKDTNFLFSNPLCLLNTQYENGNVDSESGRSLLEM